MRASHLLLLLAAALAPAGNLNADSDQRQTLVVTQVPVERGVERRLSMATGILRADYGEGGRIVMIRPGADKRILTEEFHSAADPNISFDGKRMLFAGKKKASDDWSIFEMELQSSHVRQITRGVGDCRSPTYQGTLYTIVSAEPWQQITFVGNGAGEINEYGSSPSTSLYSCRMDGSAARRVTFNPSSDLDPTVLPDGRLLFSSWQRSTLERGSFGRVSLFAAHTDGIDYALFSGDEGRSVKLMPCVTSDRQVVFVEGKRPRWDGSGTLASVSLRRNLHSYRPITREGDGLFHSPSPLPDGRILASRRPDNDAGDHGVYRLDPSSGQIEPVFDDPNYHDVQARLVLPRPRPDGRSSVVNEKNPNGVLYCLNARESDLPGPDPMTPGAPLRLRVLEGVPRHREDEGARVGIPPLLQRRFLGVIPVEEDGSFNVQVPANIPIQLQLLDASGMALRSCGWIWVRNHETRGCIGCHEDGERTPDNRFVDALHRPSIDLTLAAEKRRTVDFRRDVLPIISQRCSACHTSGEREPDLSPGGAGRFYRAYVSLLAGLQRGPEPRSPFGRYVHPGSARTSPLIRHLLGEGGSQHADRLRQGEIQTFVEWIDLGALWDGIPEAPRVDRGGAK